MVKTMMIKASTPSRQRTFPVVLLGLMAILYGGHANLYRSWVEDDAFISFQYARNLAVG